MEARFNDDLKNGYLELLSDFAVNREANLFVTLQFHKWVEQDIAEKNLRHFDNMVSKKLFGKRHYNKTEQKNREFAWIGVLEMGRVSGNPHFHLLVSIPPDLEYYSAKKVNWIKYVEAFTKYTPVIWKKMVQTGQAKVQEMSTDTDRKKAANYCVKSYFKNTFEIIDCSMVR